ncbi:MAG: hypothetical protein QOE11_1245, partial [Solirubrobacteraceae bacterium]|nr:hypothetical protein [Solirubrobacteraceae bacterium]
ERFMRDTAPAPAPAPPAPASQWGRAARMEAAGHPPSTGAGWGCGWDGVSH